MQTVKCRYCKKQIDDKYNAYKVGKASYYCNEECYNNAMAKRNKAKDKYEPIDPSDRRVYTDYIVKIYTDNGYDKSEIPWQLIGVQTKNILQEHEVWSYSTLQYILYYMYEVLELNLFSEESNGSILSLLPFYGLEAEKYFNHTKEIEESIKNFNFKDNEIVIKKSCCDRKKKYIDLGELT